MTPMLAIFNKRFVLFKCLFYITLIYAFLGPFFNFPFIIFITKTRRILTINRNDGTWFLTEHLKYFNAAVKINEHTSFWARLHIGYSKKHAGLNPRQSEYGQQRHDKNAMWFCRITRDIIYVCCIRVIASFVQWLIDAIVTTC